MRKMKDSGIEWIGQIPEHWKCIDIKYNFRILAGSTPKSDNPSYWDGDIIWITPADYKTEDKFISKGSRNISQEGLNSCSSTLVPKGSLIFSKRAPIGAVAINTESLCTNQGCLSCIPKSKDANSVYHYYVMSIATSYFEMLGSGTTFKEISANKFSNALLPCPPVFEQRAIAEYLDKRCGKIDSAIGAAKELIEEYKEYKRSLITEAVTKGLDPKVKTKDSGVEWIGKIPEHWNVTKVKYLGDLQSGDNITSEDINGDGLYPVYGGNGYRGCYDKYTNDGEYVLIGRQGALAGNVHLVTGKFWATDHALVFYSNGKSENKYAYYGFLSMNLNQYAFETAAQPGLAATKILNLQFILSPIPEQKAIAKYLDEKCSLIDSLISEKESLVSELEEYKKSLIFECVTGKKEIA